MKNRKIKTLPNLLKTITALKKRKKKIAFTNGCFDILHLGHVRYLQAARKKADILVLALNSDQSVRMIKGPMRPINNEHDRAGILAALECVDFITVFNAPTPLKVIEKLKPDVLIKGSDWKNKDIIGARTVTENGGKIHRENFLKGYSTSKLIKKIVKKSKTT